MVTLRGHLQSRGLIVNQTMMAVNHALNPLMLRKDTGRPVTYRAFKQAATGTHGAYLSLEHIEITKGKEDVIIS